MFSRLRKRKRVNQRIIVIQNRMFRTAFSWCHDPALAQDLTQEAALKAIENAAQLNDLEAIDAWIFTILSNCHRAHLRKAIKMGAPETSYEGSIEANLLPDRITETHALIDRVKAALASLSVEQRQVMTLVDLEEFSYAEVASILEIPIGTVMSRLNRARQLLKKRLLAKPIPGTAAVAYLKKQS
jgi:RNA polymerase sigma-70 factor (ECF subfamily)